MGALVASALSVAALAGVALTGPVACAAQRPAAEAQTVVDGLEFPTGIAFDAAGTMYVTEKVGRLRVVTGRQLEPDPLAEFLTNSGGEAGLLGVASEPGARGAGGAVYVFVTDPELDENRVMRVPLDGSQPQLVLDGLPASSYHNGGGLAFDDDGMLLVANGERHEGELAQDPAALGGKVYRVTPQGEVAPDNPFGDLPAYALGLRNPFGIAVDPVSGAPFVTENGPGGNDEVNRIVAGGNYGWPLVMGVAPDPPDVTAGEYREPLIDHPETVVPTGIAFADPANARRAYSGDLFYATYGEQAIHRVRLDASRARALNDGVFVATGEPVIALAWGPRGLYYSTPSAVKLLPLAADPASDRRPAASPDRGPSAGEVPFDDVQTPGRGWAAAATVVLVGLVAAGVVLVFRRG